MFLDHRFHLVSPKEKTYVGVCFCGETWTWEVRAERVHHLKMVIARYLRVKQQRAVLQPLKRLVIQSSEGGLLLSAAEMREVCPGVNGSWVS